VSCRQGSHGDVPVKGNSVTHQQMSHCCFGIQDPSPLPRPGRFHARSNSHTVAARSSCTKIPIAAGRAQEDETIGKYPPAEPGALGIGPLEAAIRVANATLHLLAT
jgi:hypothetical protein